MVFHHLRVRLLYVFYQPIHLCVYVFLGDAVIREKVDQPHRAGFTDVQIRRKGAGIVTVGELVRKLFV